MKALVVLLAASGLLLASQCPAQAQVSWGIPLPFPFLFYNFNQGYQQPQPYYGNQRAYYSQPYYGGQRVYYRPGYSRPGDCTPSRHAYFIAPITSRAITTDHNRAIITGRNLATMGLAGADTEVGKSSVDGRRHPIALNSWVSNSAFTEHSGVVHDAIEPAEMFHGKIHQRFGFGRTCSVCAVKRYVFSEFLFECLPFFF